MKKLVLRTAVALAFGMAGQAGAADLPVGPAPAPVYTPMFFSWTGFYVGGNIGGVFSQGSLQDSLTGFTAGTNQNGFIGGGQIGFNYQFLGGGVVGIEGTFDGTSLNRTSNAVPTGFGTFQASDSTKWISTLAARLGIVSDRWLAYGKAGVGWADNSITITNTATGATLLTASDTRPGWLAGVGIEYAFTPSWTAKVEYDFLGLSDWSTAGILPNDTVHIRRQIQTLTVGVNYKFDWGGPLVARY
jgi:opacity protein-like surface antigen